MTLSSTRSSETLLADGHVREWPFFFKAWEGELRVVVAGPEGDREDVTALCGVALHEGGGGVVRYPASSEAPALPAGWKLTVLRDMDMLQQVDLVPGARFDSEVLEGAFDRVMATVQQLAEELGRAIKLYPGNEAPPPAAEELYDRVQELAGRAAEAVARAGRAAAEAAGSASAAARAEEGAESAGKAAALSGEAAGQSARAAAAALAELTGLSVTVMLVGCAVPPSGEYDPATGVLLLRIPDCSGGSGEVILSDATDGERAAADGVGASELALALVSAKADAAAAAAVAAGGAAEAAGGLASGLYIDCDEALRADEEYALARRLYLTNEDCSGLPTAVPAFFAVTLGGGGVLQTCWNDGEPELYLRKGRVAGGEEGAATWLPWTMLGGPPAAPVGDMRLLPFRAAELPAGWYFCNGDGVALASPQGAALAALPSTFKADWGITESAGSIYLPNMFYTDGRGFFLRAADGATRSIGMSGIQTDAIRNITGTIVPQAAPLSASGAFAISTVSLHIHAANTRSYSVGFDFNASRVVPTAEENLPLNIGMTPAIYLGV